MHVGLKLLVILVVAFSCTLLMSAEQKGRVVLITGASRGVGLATAEHLAKEGFRVYRNGFKSWSFGNAGALNLNQAKLSAKQRVCRHTCDAAGFKVKDAGAAKNQILSSFRYICWC